MSDDKQPKDLHAEIEQFLEDLKPHIKLNSERVAGDMLRATLRAFCEVTKTEVGYFMVSGDGDGGRQLGRYSRENLDRVLAPRYRIAETDEGSDPSVYVMKYQDPTAGQGIAGVWRDEDNAIERARRSAHDCCRFPDADENWPKEVQTYGKEILRIEYGPESYNTVECHEVQ